MIEIRHKETGAVLHRLEADTLQGAKLAGLNLCSADLHGANLAGADLTGVVCSGIDLRGANLAHANLSGVYLLQADLRGANLDGALLLIVSLDGADLTGASLAGANLTGSYLAEARLTRTRLTYANLQSAYLGDADLTGAQLAYTILADCPSLHLATGLDEIQHFGPSMPDLVTLRAGATSFPQAFLQGIGLTQEEIDTVRALYSEPIQRSSCLLAYAEGDTRFADRLRADLLSHDVSCWLYRYDMGGGYRVQVLIDQARQQIGRLVLIWSRDSSRQPELMKALTSALELEHKTGTQRLCFVRLDDAVPGEEIAKAVDYNPVTGEWHEDWARFLRAHPSLDFRHWQNSDRYQQAFRELLGVVRSVTPE